MRQHLIRIQLQQPLRYRDGSIELTLLLQRADETVHGIEHARIHFEAITQLLRGSNRVAFCEPVEPLVVEVFRRGGVRRWGHGSIMMIPAYSCPLRRPRIQHFFGHFLIANWARLIALWRKWSNPGRLGPAGTNLMEWPIL